jgi:hypothetical protein
VELHGLVADAQTSGNGLVRQTIGEELHHLYLARGQRVHHGMVDGQRSWARWIDVRHEGVGGDARGTSVGDGGELAHHRHPAAVHALPKASTLAVIANQEDAHRTQDIPPYDAGRSPTVTGTSATAPPRKTRSGVAAPTA